jgi:hypothetical protein
MAGVSVTATKRRGIYVSSKRYRHYVWAVVSAFGGAFIGGLINFFLQRNSLRSTHPTPEERVTPA